LTAFRAAIFAAVSTASQAADDRDSLPEQIRRAREVCQREGWREVALLQVPGQSRSTMSAQGY
jgi:hypothetical protein